jgi:ATP-dependent Clp endopeptidase proteolytic subunit ClpP
MDSFAPPMWCASNKKRSSKKRKREADDDDDDSGGMPMIPIIMPRQNGNSSLCSQLNHVYFNDDINNETAFALCKELRTVESQLLLTTAMFKLKDERPIYLHITTNGGCIHSALQIVDCIERLRVPVYTVVEGFVASAGTLMLLAGTKRFIGKNAYTLIHELRSGVWGKMSSMEEEIGNLKKIMDHLVSFYTEKTGMTKKALEKLLTKDVIWNADESISRGLVESVYTEE